MGLVSGLGRSPGEGNSNPLQNSCLGNPMDRQAWQTAVHGVAKSQTWLSTHTYNVLKSRKLISATFILLFKTVPLPFHLHCRIIISIPSKNILL